MKKNLVFALTCMMILAGCAKPTESIPETVVSTVAEQKTVETQSEGQKIVVTETQSALPETLTESIQAYNYRLLTDQDEDGELVPSITLFSDGTYGFSFDVLSSYFAAGTYKIEENLLKAVTSEGDREYVFQIEQEGNLMFMKKESADVTLTDEDVEVPLLDGSIFSLKSAMDESSTMQATVKEVLESSVLVKSHEDSQPGAFYVELPPTVDLSAFKGGETVTIIWYGLIRETSPAQITAMYMYQE